MAFTTLNNWFRNHFGRPRAVLILGMHRSDAGFLATALGQSGVCFTPQSGQPDAIESPRLIALNDAVLAESGGSWDQPPEQVEWSGARLAQAGELADGFSGVRIRGLKDPRLLLTLEGWQQVLPRMQRVGVFRHPLAVARSLHKHCGISDPDQALRLWLVYNHRLLAEYRRAPFPVLCFDQHWESPDLRARKVARALGLPGPRRIACFDSDRVVEQPNQNSVLPPDVQSLHASLQTIALV